MIKLICRNWDEVMDKLKVDQFGCVSVDDITDRHYHWHIIKGWLSSEPEDKEGIIIFQDGGMVEIFTKLEEIEKRLRSIGCKIS
jgi:hypothetical protein